MHVLLVHGWWEDDHPGGVVRVIETLAHTLRAAGLEVTILTGDGVRTHPELVTERPVARYRMRLPAAFGRGPRWRNWLGWRLRAPAVRRALAAFVADRGIDLVHLHYVLAYQDTFRRLRQTGGPPYLVTVHGTDVARLGQIGPAERRAVLRVLAGAAAVTAVSETLATQVREFGPQARAVLNALEADVLARAARWVGTGVPAQPYALCLGRLRREKGFDLAIEAWRRLAARSDLPRLVIAGSGPESAALADQCAEAGLGETVHFEGWLDRAAALERMSGAALVIVPSRREGMGLVPVEAAALGRPVLMSRIAVFGELAREGVDAWMFTPDDADDLAAQVARLLDSPARAQAMAVGWRDAVIERHSQQRQVAAYIDLYRQALTGY